MTECCISRACLITYAYRRAPLTFPASVSLSEGSPKSMVVADIGCCSRVCPCGYCGCRFGGEFHIWKVHVDIGKRPRRAPLQASPTPHSPKNQANMTVARVRHAAAYITLVFLATVGMIPRVEAFHGGGRTALTRPHDSPAAASSVSIVGLSSRNAGMFVCCRIRRVGFFLWRSPRVLVTENWNVVAVYVVRRLGEMQQDCEVDIVANLMSAHCFLLAWSV